MPALRIDDQHDSVKSEQCVKRRIALHVLSLSHTDNCVQAARG
jgi:hypothetical protein